MQVLPNLLLFLLTLAGGSVPLWLQGINDRRLHLLLAFSGSFLLSITFLHLLPDTFEEPGGRTGFLLLAGFFLQLLIQRYTHGVEHGHTHIHTHEGHQIPLWSIVIGLSVHAVMEGLPLGFHYRNPATGPSLYLAVAAHKLPEAMILGLLVMSARGKRVAIETLIIFSLLTPLAGVAATLLGQHYGAVARMITAMIPVVAGAFIHIATTIFFESGTRQHLLTGQKVLAMLLGVSLALLTLFLE